MTSRAIPARAALRALLCFVLLAGCAGPPPPQTPATAAATSSATAESEVPRVVPAVPALAPQKISGLGVNANVHSWKNGQLKPAIDQIAALGELTWRVIIDKADWESSNGGTDPGTIDWEHYTPIYDQGKMADLWSTIAYINSKPGQQVMINVMGGVPDWMGATHINPGAEDNWVRMIASMVYFGKKVRKLDFTLLAPMNEPDWNGIEGPQVAPEQYVRLLHKLADSLDRLGLQDIRFVGPDTASAQAANDAYLPALAKDPAIVAKLAHFAIHSYDGGTFGSAEALAASALHRADLWVTEFAGPCPGCDDGAPNPAGWDSAAATADFALKLLQQGASGMQFYDAWDGYYEHHKSLGYWGALAYNARTGRYSPRKSYYVLKQLFSYVPRNSIRVDASIDQEPVSVVAFRDPATGRLTVVGRNTGSTASNVRITMTGQAMSGPLQNYRTDVSSDMIMDKSVSLDQGAATFSASPNSVFTLTGFPTGG